MQASYTFAEAKLVKAVLQYSISTIYFAPKGWYACIFIQAS